MDARLYQLFYQQENRHWWFQARKRIVLAQIRRWLGASRRLSILDLGCGTGMILEAMRPLGEVWGLDASRQALDFCRRRGLRRLLEVQFPGAMPAGGPRELDLVTALDVLEHLPDDRGALRQIFQLLRPGGFLLLTAPAYDFLWSPHDAANHHLRRYARRQLQERLTAAGFQVRKLTYYNFFLFAPIWLRKRLDRRRYGSQPFSHLETPPPAALGRVLEGILWLESLALRKLSFPFGVSLLAVAQKPDNMTP